MGWLGPEEWQAVALSLRVSLWATLVSLPLGIFTAYALARWRFPGHGLVNGLVHLPLILPPVVTGYLLLLSFGTRGPVGGLLQELGIVLAFRWTGAALAAHPEVDVLSFTGGTATGRAIMSAAGRNLTPVTLELGGKSANIIFADADFDRALDGALLSIFSNNGQQCLAGSRILVQEELADRFIEAFVERARKLRIGDPLLEDTEIGPLATKQHFERVHSFIDTLEADGCELLLGGKPCEGFKSGYYYEPTIVRAPNNKAVVCQEEIFGPFATFQTFRTADEAWAIANDSKFGLLGYVWTTDYATAMAAHEHVKSGVLCINSPIIRELRAPFGGYKESGVGRESGAACEAFYSEVKTTAFLTGDVPLRKLGMGGA